MRFNYFEPASVEEALDTLRHGDGRYKLLAGGTDLIIHLRRRAAHFDALVNIKLLPDIAASSAKPGEGIHFGAAASLRSIETSPTIPKQFPALAEAIGVIGSLQLRNSATIGGNLCNASPSADCAPALIVAGATASYRNDDDGDVTLPVREFFEGPGRSVLGSTGLLLAVDVPEFPGLTGNSFERFTPRNAMDIAIASAASQVTLGQSSGLVEEVTIALGAVAPTPIRAYKAEDMLLGKEPDPDLLERASEVAMDECSPIDDIRGTAAYRRQIIRVLVRRTLERAIMRARS